MLPPAVAGLALLLVFGRRGLLGGAYDLAFTTAAVVLAQTFVSAPFFVRSARAGIAAVDRDFEDARYTRSGPYVTMRLKFDQLSLQSLGLGGR